MKNSGIYLLVLLYLLFILGGCRQDRQDIPDVSALEVNARFVPYWQLLDSVSRSADPQALVGLCKRYPAFSDLYFNQVLAIQPFDPFVFKDSLSIWFQSPFMRQVHQAIDSIYGDFRPWADEFIQAFKYLQHYFPEQPIPTVYTYNSELGVANMIFQEDDNDALGIGLEFFLPGSIPYKRIDPMNPNFSDYVVRTYNQDHLVKKTLESWVDDRIAPVKTQQMLDFMINHGKKLFILEKLLPYTMDTVIFEYTPAQMSWCRENEAQIWTYFSQEKLIYEQEMRKVQRYVFPAPVSPGMPDGAPGRTGDFIGYKIVQAYMQRYPETSLQTLAQDQDAQAIMDGARYRPR